MASSRRGASGEGAEGSARGGFINGNATKEGRDSGLTAFTLKWNEARTTVLLFFQHLDFELGILEARFTDLEQLIAFLKAGQEVGEGDIAGFHGFDNPLKPFEGSFKGKDLSGFGLHGRGHYFVASEFQSRFGKVPSFIQNGKTRKPSGSFRYGREFPGPRDRI